MLSYQEVLAGYTSRLGYTVLNVPPGAIVVPPTIGPNLPYSTPLGTVINEYTNTPSKVYIACDQAFAITASGLKPSTTHTFTFNGVDVTSMCQQSGKIYGAGLTTDASGKISFTFYYNSGISSGTNVTSTQALINNIIGNKIGILSSSDNTSTASVAITIATPKPTTTAVAYPVGLGGGHEHGLETNV
jgi:hypothetical protein